MRRILELLKSRFDFSRKVPLAVGRRLSDKNSVFLFRGFLQENLLFSLTSLEFTFKKQEIMKPVGPVYAFAPSPGWVAADGAALEHGIMEGDRASGEHRKGRARAGRLAVIVLLAALPFALGEVAAQTEGEFIGLNRGARDTMRLDRRMDDQAQQSSEYRLTDQKVGYEQRKIREERKEKELLRTGEATTSRATRFKREEEERQRARLRENERIAEKKKKIQVHVH